MISPQRIAQELGLPQPTEEQAAVIAAPPEPALVVAGAGAGKTETMAARVVWLVANRIVTPERILGLTFTRKAARQLGDRVRARLRRRHRRPGLRAGRGAGRRALQHRGRHRGAAPEDRRDHRRGPLPGAVRPGRHALLPGVRQRLDRLERRPRGPLAAGPPGPVVGDPRRRLTLAPPAGAVHPLGVGGAVVVPGPFLRDHL